MELVERQYEIPFPPFDGGVPRLKGKRPERFLDILRKSAKCIAHSEASFLRPQESSSFKHGIGVGAH